MPRADKGIAGALVVPNSLALLETTFHGEARGVAIGKWSAWSTVSTALGPLAGGWLVDAASWRFVFFSVVPFAIAAAWIAFRHESAADRATKHESSSLDYAGAVLCCAVLCGAVRCGSAGCGDDDQREVSEELNHGCAGGRWLDGGTIPLSRM